MICEKVMHCVICDKCGKMFVNADGQAFFETEEEAGQEAFDVECTKPDGSIDYGYNFVEGEKEGTCYCSKCAKELGLVCDGECDSCPDKGTDECPESAK